MEVLSKIFIGLCAVCSFTAMIACIVWIIMLLIKNNQSKNAKYIFLFSLLGIIISFIVALSTYPSCDHNWETTENVQATCTKSGRIVRYCSLCNQQVIKDSDPTGHSWKETTKEPTCFEPGEHHKKCFVCGAETTEVLIAQHDYTEEIISNPLCETDGKAKKFCSICGDEKEIVLSATGHNWTDGADTTPKICSVCGISDPNFVEILFREIPWRTTSADTAQILKKDNVAASIQILEDAFILSPEDLLEPYSMNGIDAGGNILYAYNLTAGGYDVEMAQLHFIYRLKGNQIDRNTDFLYAAAYYLDVIEDDTVYNDLQQKMSDIYGEGKEKTGSISGIIASAEYTGKYTHTVKRTTWYGANNTFVTLQWIYDDNQAESVQASCGISLVYGKTDIESSLSDMKKALKLEKANADKENAKNNSEGL